MANNFSYADVFQTELDRQVVQDAVTGWMEANAGQVKYEGGKNVKIPKITLDGLGNYDRENGYDRGAVTLTYESREMTQDRGKQFLLDAMDVNESNFVATAGAVMGEFQKVMVVPEIDAYRISAVATAAPAANVVDYTVAKATIVDAIKDAIKASKEGGFVGQKLVCHISTSAMSALEKAVGTENIRAERFTTPQGFDTRVLMIDDVPLIETVQNRMYTAITIKTTAQGGGYAKAASGKDIHFVVMPQLAPIAVSKQDAIKIFDPSVVQDHDAWKIDYRRYHDLWVKDNMKAGIVVYKEA